MTRPCATLLVLTLMLVVGCSDDTPTGPGGGDQRLSVGGGRQSPEDPLVGGPDDSGPANPEFDPPSGGFFPLFYADLNCRLSPSQGVIRDQADWQAWWTGALECLGGDDDPPPPLRGLFEGDPSDSGVVTPEDPYAAEAPPVDFMSNVVLTIALEPDSGFGRSVWVEDVATTPTGSVVRYLVSELGEDCLPLIMAPYVSGSVSPTIAVMVPHPLDEPVAWQREEVVYDCSWEPDPHEPVALYYTDAECDLGPRETLITDSATFEEWIDSALACDTSRWYDSDSLGVPGDTGGIDPTTSPGNWVGMQVDFTTHAVLVLRADPEDRWGGGIWLSGLERNATGTAIDYTVMIPSSDCPLVAEGGMLQPTVAIRVPLPLDTPVTWNRHTETIDCSWEESDPGGGVDSTGVSTAGQ
jgi:hypothetical protein